MSGFDQGNRNSDYLDLVYRGRTFDENGNFTIDSDLKSAIDVSLSATDYLSDRLEPITLVQACVLNKLKEPKHRLLSFS